MSNSRSGSKSDLNESNMPLLEGEQAKAEEAGEKVEMEEKEDAGKEKKGKKKEKKPKEPKGPSCLERNTAQLNLNDRDDKSINVEIDVSEFFGGRR